MPGRRKGKEKLAVMKDAPTRSFREVSVLSTGQRTPTKNAVITDAPTNAGREEHVKGTEQMLHTKYAATKDAQTMLCKEEYAKGMGQRLFPKLAVIKDALTLPSKGGSVKSMGRWLLLERNAVMRDAPILREEKKESAGGMGRRMERRLLQKHADTKGVLTKFGKEESAKCTGQKLFLKLVVMKDVQTMMRRKEVFVESMGLYFVLRPKHPVSIAISKNTSR